MSMKRMGGGLVVLALVAFCGAGLFAADAWAWHGGGYGRQQYAGLTPEMQAKYDAALKAYHNKVSPLMEKMMARRLELNALAGNANADPKRITALAEEIASLKTQLRQERGTLDEQLKNEVGIAERGAGMRYGRPGGQESGRAFDGPCNGPNYAHREPCWGGYRSGPWNRPDCGGNFREQRDPGNCPRNF